MPRNQKPIMSPIPVDDSRKMIDALWLFELFLNCDNPVILNVAGIAEKTGVKPNTIVKRVNTLQHRYPGFGIVTRTTGARISSNLSPSVPKTDANSSGGKSAAKPASSKGKAKTAEIELVQKESSKRRSRTARKAKQDQESDVDAATVNEASEIEEALPAKTVEPKTRAEKRKAGIDTIDEWGIEPGKLARKGRHATLKRRKIGEMVVEPFDKPVSIDEADESANNGVRGFDHGVNTDSGNNGNANEQIDRAVPAGIEARVSLRNLISETPASPLASSSSSAPEQILAERDIGKENGDEVHQDQTCDDSSSKSFPAKTREIDNVADADVQPIQISSLPTGNSPEPRREIKSIQSNTFNTEPILPDDEHQFISQSGASLGKKQKATEPVEQAKLSITTAAGLEDPAGTEVTPASRDMGAFDAASISKNAEKQLPKTLLPNVAESVLPERSPRCVKKVAESSDHPTSGYHGTGPSTTAPGPDNPTTQVVAEGMEPVPSRKWFTRPLEWMVWNVDAKPGETQGAFKLGRALP